VVLLQVVAPQAASVVTPGAQAAARRVGTSLEFIDVDHCLRKCVRGLLRKIVANATGELTVLISAGKVLGVRGGLGMKRSVGVTVQCDGRNADVYKSAFDLSDMSDAIDFGTGGSMVPRCGLAAPAGRWSASLQAERRLIVSL
jgi:hypothetical protein